MVRFIENKVSLLIAVLLFGMANFIFMMNEWMTYLYILIEILILAYFFLRKDIVKYVVYLIAFVSISFEFDVFMPNSNWYGLIKLDLLGIRAVIFLLIPIMFLLVPKWRIIKEKFKERTTANKIIKLLIFCFITAVIMGLINILINNNNISSLKGFWPAYFGLCYFYGFSIGTIVLFYFTIIIEESNFKDLKEYLILLLIGLAFLVIVSVIFIERGKYDKYAYLLVPTATFFIPLLIFSPFYQKEKRFQWTLFLIGVVGFIVLIGFGGSGKSIILAMLLPIILIIKTLAQMKNKALKKKIIILMIFVIVAFFLFSLSYSIQEPQNLLHDKFNQVISLFQINNPNYLVSMPPSPRCRVLEILNIIYDYKENLLMFPFGKGFLGSFSDHTGMLYGIGEAFSQNQWDAGLFYLPHESFSRLFLMNGVVGVYLFYYIIKTAILNCTKSAWTVIGVTWFVFFYGYSISLSFFGIACFVIGLVEIDKNKNNSFDVVVLDFIFEKAHGYWCNHFVNTLNKNANTIVLNSGDYYDFHSTEKNMKIEIKTKQVSGHSFIKSRCNILYNMYQNLRYINKYKTSKVIILGYEGITFAFFRRIINRNGEIYIAYHHQLDELKTSKLKTWLFHMYKKKIKHIVLEKVIKTSVSTRYSINESNIFVYPIPMLEPNKEKTIDHNNIKQIISLSNSNDEIFTKNLYEFELREEFLKKNYYQLIIRTKMEYGDCSSIKFVRKFLDKETYDRYFAQADYVLIPFPNSFEYRASGSIVDAISMKKKIICSKFLVSEDYSIRFPSLCKTYDSLEDFVLILKNSDNNIVEKEFDEFVNEHNACFEDRCMKEILK